MKELKRDLQTVAKGLKSLTQKIEKVSKKLDKLEKGQAAKKSKGKATAKTASKTVAGKATRVTASDTVLNIIKMSRKGVDTAALKKETDFSDKKIWNIINRLKRQRKIKSALRGVYVKV